MSSVHSVSPSTKIAEMRDQQSFPVVLYTKLGRNGLRDYRLTDMSSRPIDLTGLDLRVVVKTSEDAADTELDASFPLTATITGAGNGEFSVDFAAVNFLVTQGRVIFVVYDASGANPIILSQSTTVIRKAGV